MTHGYNRITNNAPLITTLYMPRPRIDSILDQATQCRLVYVIAGAGYGKTQAALHYIERQADADAWWVQLNENNNNSSHFWENLTHVISCDNPELASKLRVFGFPETPSRFKQFAEIVKKTERGSAKKFLVLDDFHLLQSPQILDFVERCAHLAIPGACVVIISRKEPAINAVSLFAKGQAAIITEDELRFMEDEIAAFLKSRAILFSARNLAKYAEATKGWALAVQLLSLVLKRIPANPNLAIGTLKQNIFKLMETEAFNDLPENAQRVMVKLALLSDLPLTPLQMISGDETLMQNNPQLSAFIWFDSLAGDYRIHPLYLEFLQSKGHLISQAEKHDTYCQAAEWCAKNDFYMAAMRYFALSRQYKRMLTLLLSYPFKLPYDACEYFYHILAGLEADDEEQAETSVLLLKNFFIPILLMGMGRYEEASKLSFENIRKWERSDLPFALNILYASYSNLAYIDMYTCTVTHKYDAPWYLKKSVEYFKLSTIPPVKVAGAFAVADIRTFACPVGEGAVLEEFDQFLEAARQTAFYITENFHDMYYGFEDLAACEIAFYKNQPQEAKKYAHQAILKANEKNQYSIVAMAEHHLLRISLQEGNYLLTKETIKHLRRQLDNPNFWSRQLLYDLSLGYFYAQIGLPHLSPSWLVSDEKEVNSEIHSPVGELIICVKNYIALKKYDQALTVLCNSYPRKPQVKFLFGELTLALLTAVARIQTANVAGALEDFKRAYDLSFNGVFEMSFVELGKELQPLVAAASRQADCGIPEQWLKMIGRKASVYAKKTAVILNSFKKENSIEDTIQLSGREQEVLFDLSHGLSREEIAEYRCLSVNTVKKILQSVYTKLNANNNADAIRIALDNKLIE